MLSIKNYKYQYKSWKDKFPSGKINIKDLFNIDESWIKFFESLDLFNNNKMKLINNILEEEIKKNKNVYPYPDLLFSAFKYINYNDLKVIFIGQDPYHKSEDTIPLAMGLSFSVPEGITIPSSLKNIYRNMIKFNHLKEMPKHGNLESWAKQGCLLLNTALTVREGAANSHAQIWQWFTDEIISEISRVKENLIFVLWGIPALSKIKFIHDDKGHEIIISSHPSGLSCYKKMRNNYPAFMDNDHFGEINNKLKKFNKNKIIFC